MKDNKSKHLEQAQGLRQQFAQHAGSAFEQALSVQNICSVVEQHSNVTARQRLYPPLKTLSLFIAQILDGARACQDAVVRNLAQRISSVWEHRPVPSTQQPIAKLACACPQPLP